MASNWPFKITLKFDIKNMNTDNKKREIFAMIIQSNNAFSD